APPEQPEQEATAAVPERVLPEASASVATFAGVTFRLTPAVWDNPPLVPRIVRLEVAAGVEVEVVTVRVEEPDPPIEAGLKLPLAPEGSPLALRETVPPKPPFGLMLTV